MSSVSKVSAADLLQEEPSRILQARIDADRQPVLNLQIAKAYLADTDSGVTGRIWSDAFSAVIATKQWPNQERWVRIKGVTLHRDRYALGTARAKSRLFIDACS